MIKSFYQFIDKRAITLLLIMLILSPILWGKNTYTNCLIYSHYPSIYMNNVYLLMMYQCASRFNTLAPYFITRVKQEKFYIYTYIVFISAGILYTATIYISYFFFFGAIPTEYFLFTIHFMLLNLIVMGIESTLIYLQIGQKKNFLYLFLPILINFLFHVIYPKLF